jgi:hypothetical protein
MPRWATDQSVGKPGYGRNPHYMRRKIPGIDSPRNGGRGLSAAEVAAVIERQGGVCLICQRVPRRWDIDHDHSCPRCGGEHGCRFCFRGMLCSGCNSMLGFAADSPETLRRAAAYVEAARERLREHERRG